MTKLIITYTRFLWWKAGDWTYSIIGIYEKKSNGNGFIMLNWYIWYILNWSHFIVNNHKNPVHVIEVSVLVSEPDNRALCDLNIQ